MHEVFVIPGVIDASVIQKQADARSRDLSFPEDTIVHSHRVDQKCNDECVIYRIAKQVDGDYLTTIEKWNDD